MVAVIERACLRLIQYLHPKHMTGLGGHYWFAEHLDSNGPSITGIGRKP